MFGLPKRTGLPRMLLRVVGLCLSEIARRVCHELGQGRLVAEAIGLALDLRIDGAVRLYVLAVCEAHRAHVLVLAGHGESCSGHADEESARDYRTDVRSHAHLLSVGDLRRSLQKTIVHLGSSAGGQVFVTDLPLGHSRRNWRQHDQRGQIEDTKPPTNCARIL